jgi:hypothetical protein
MSELTTAPADPQDVVEAPAHVIEAVRQPQVIITEHTHGVIAALRTMFLGSPRNVRPERRHYPPRRDSFFEKAAMAREMQREMHYR